MTAIDYSGSTVVIPGYRCGDCGKRGVKLWRLRYAMVTWQQLRCARCACKRAGVDFRELNGYGQRRAQEYGIRFDTYRIGDMVPAGPSDAVGSMITSYWTQRHWPPKAWDWWLQLPL